MSVRARARVEGTVQGVGFRPFVLRLAREMGLAGFVLNDSRGVLVEIEGEMSGVERFMERMRAEAPPLSTVERVLREAVAPTGAMRFEIVSSPFGGEPSALVSPDTATCPACRAELLDPRDRRFRYPFINCTNCGPRFTIVCGVPYDRPLTTMAGFVMCARCRREYEDPGDRRFHAQPNACPDCGPSVRVLDAAGRSVDLAGADDPVMGAAAALQSGRIVAVKGVGGFHLACRADDEDAVARLRERKRREEKPLALMVAGVEGARALVALGPEDEALLGSRERPIVVARRQPHAAVARAVAPGSPDLGVMLAYSPLHHLLAGDLGVPLVMTSGNVSDEPIAYDEADALERLGAIADLFLVHDRPIRTRTDDSVARTVAVAGRRRPLFLRRSRGYGPASMDLPIAVPRPLLACGAELKNTFAVAKGGRAWLGPHIGDLSNYETLLSFTEGIEHFERLFAVAPALVAHDLHPEYLSTKYAHERQGVELVGVQHHHAHLAAVLAEHGERGPAVGAIYDGTGYGTDTTVWGGELLVGGLDHFERAGHLRSVRMPGGERAIREPWRMACAWLVAAQDADPVRPAVLADEVDPATWRAVTGLVHSGLASPQTSSMGRLFDAVAALCGLRARVTYEGQAAIELEAVADDNESGAYPLPALSTGSGLGLDPRETILAVTSDLQRGTLPATVSARFHNAVAEATAGACEHVARGAGLDTLVLGGGVFQNRRLLEHTATLATAAGLRVLTPERLPPNDGGLALGQCAIAAAADARR